MSKLLKAYDRSRIPLYIQVASVMRQRIDSQQWLPGQKISTLVELEREFQVARVTVRQAVDVLCEEGLLQCYQGRGTFVSEKPPDRHWLKLATDWDVMIAQIKDNVPRRIRVDNPPAFPELQEGEGELAEDYKFLRSVQFKENAPFGIVNVHIARHIFERDPEAFLEHPALSVLAEIAKGDIHDAHQTVVIGSADPQTADYLKIALGAPTAQCRCVVKDAHGLAIYVADITYRSDVIKLHIDLLATARSGKPRAGAAKAGPDRNVARLKAADDAAIRVSRRARLSS
jgi:GntR family transcriptional regulator